MTSSVIFSTKTSNTSTIKTSGQPLTTSEMMYITKVRDILSSYEVIDILSSFVTLSLQPQ